MNYRKRILRSFLVMLTVLSFAGAYLYFALWIPNQKMIDLDWWESASPDEMRETCHDVLSFGIGNHHDAFLHLAVNGNSESVPLLINSLKWQPEPAGDGLMVCTTGHCLDALRSLTGYNAGSRYSEWETWWETTGSKLPSDQFYPHLGNEKE